MQFGNTRKTTLLLAALMDIVNPVFGGLAGLFRTHPDTNQRIMRLRALTRH